jgi:hypothetical protein
MESDSDHSEIENVDVSKIRPGPIRHETLSEDVLTAIQFSYETVGHYVKPTLEQYELDFMRDAQPEREVAVWLRIAFAWQLYHERYITNTVLSDEQETNLVITLVLISMGVTDPKQHTKVTTTVGTDLLKCWWDVFEQMTEKEE